MGILDSILGQCALALHVKRQLAGVFEWLDKNGDGNPIGDGLGMAKGFLGKQ